MARIGLAAIMIMYYCEICGTKVADSDVESGDAFKDGDAVYCMSCTSVLGHSAQKPKARKLGSSAASHPARRLEKKSAPKSAAINIALIGGAIAILGAVVLIAGRSPSQPQPAPLSQDSAEAAKPIVPKLDPQPKIELAAPKDLETKKEIKPAFSPEKDFEDLRNNRAARLLDDARKLWVNHPDVASITAEMARLDQYIQHPPLEIDKAQAEWEGDAIKAFGIWSTLDPVEFSSAKSKLAKAPEHSVRLDGPVSEKDTYTISAETNLTNVCAVRLEALTDFAMLRGGPGYAGGGFALTNFSVFAAPKSDPARKEPVVLSSAFADFSQENAPVEKAIDNDRDSAWLIGPQLGRPHTAVFSFSRPVGFAGGTIFTFVLDFNYGWRFAVMGRVRFSLAPGPLSSGVLSASTFSGLDTVLNTPPEKRTPGERDAIAACYRLYFDPSIKRSREKLAQLYESLRPVREYYHAIVELCGTYASTRSGAEAIKLLAEVKQSGEAANLMPASLKTNIVPFAVSHTAVPVLSGEPIDRASRLQPGLWGSYWSGTGDEHYKTLILARPDLKFCWDWQMGSPDPKVPVDHFGIKWAGKLRIEKEGTYRFKGNADDFLEVWIDGIRILEVYGTPTEPEAVLSKGDHDIAMRYFEEEGSASVCFYWRCEGRFDWQELPPELFFHDPALTEKYQQ